MVAKIHQKIADAVKNFMGTKNAADQLICVLKVAEDLGLDEYQAKASRTMDHSAPKLAQEMHALHGMVGEIGELHSIYQKVYQGHEVDPEHQKKELGDLLWFIAEYCTAKNWKLSEIAELNIEKLKARYPEGFDVEHSLHRKEGDI